MAEIMQAAGMTHGGFYKHFASKEALLAETVATTFAEKQALIVDETGRTIFHCRACCKSEQCSRIPLSGQSRPEPVALDHGNERLLPPKSRHAALGIEFAFRRSERRSPISFSKTPMTHLVRLAVEHG